MAWIAAHFHALVAAAAAEAAAVASRPSSSATPESSMMVSEPPELVEPEVNPELTLPAAATVGNRLPLMMHELVYAIRTTRPQRVDQTVQFLARHYWFGYTTKQLVAFFRLGQATTRYDLVRTMRETACELQHIATPDHAVL